MIRIYRNANTCISTGKTLDTQKECAYFIQCTRACWWTSHSLTLLSNDPEYNIPGSSLLDDKHHTQP